MGQTGLTVRVTWTVPEAEHVMAQLAELAEVAGRDPAIKALTKELSGAKREDQLRLTVYLSAKNAGAVMTALNRMPGHPLAKSAKRTLESAAVASIQVGRKRRLPAVPSTGQLMSNPKAADRDHRAQHVTGQPRRPR
jgi:hypothetical protein